MTRDTREAFEGIVAGVAKSRKTRGDLAGHLHATIELMLEHRSTESNITKKDIFGLLGKANKNEFMPLAVLIQVFLETQHEIFKSHKALQKAVTALKEENSTLRNTLAMVK